MQCNPCQLASNLKLVVSRLRRQKDNCNKIDVWVLRVTSKIKDLRVETKAYHVPKLNFSFFFTRL